MYFSYVFGRSELLEKEPDSEQVTSSVGPPVLIDTRSIFFSPQV